MNIGLVTYDFYPPIGGQGVESYGLYRAFKENPGPRATVISAAENGLDDHIRIQTGLSFAGQFAFSARLATALPRLIKERRIDLVQAYGGPGGCCFCGSPPCPWSTSRTTPTPSSIGTWGSRFIAGSWGWRPEGTVWRT